jgi:broad specificity phosphatase PhoE
VVAVTHGGVIMSTFIHLSGLPPLRQDRALHFYPGNTSITEWAITDDEVFLVRDNDNGHLGAPLPRER